jgi:nicotinate-nucleotide--dimethylbenzimidazole phosphoribosyltransferase
MNDIGKQFMKIPTISPLIHDSRIKAQERLDRLIKPVGSLGRLEEIVCRVAGITGDPMPPIDKKRIVIFAADHGVTDEGVSAYPREVTSQMVRNFLRGTAAINLLAQMAAIEVQVVDMGIEATVADPRLHSIRIRPGSRNFAVEPAMTVAEMERAVESGMRFASVAKSQGIGLAGAGEMGIGNTTAASAIYSALFEFDPIEITGQGSGISHDQCTHKANIIGSALRRWNVSPNDPWNILSHFGGYEIAALTGFYLGCASERLPVLIDGFICVAAAAIAIRAVPDCKEFFLFAHHSAERGFELAANRLEIKPLLYLNMRLGEGSGAAIAMQIVNAAMHLYRNMPTFDEAEVSTSFQ